jgi:hypothetical protein
MKAKKGQEKVESMAIKLFRLNYARDLITTFHISPTSYITLCSRVHIVWRFQRGKEEKTKEKDKLE